MTTLPPPTTTTTANHTIGDPSQDYYYSNLRDYFNVLEDLPQYRAAEMLWKVVPPVILLCGTVGNVLSLVVFRQISQQARSSSPVVVFLSALAVSDLLLLYTGLLRNWIDKVFSYDVRTAHDVTCKLHLFLTYTTSMTSAWFLVAMTLQRVTSVLWPHRVKLLCTPRSTKVILLLLTVLLVGLNVPLLIPHVVTRFQLTFTSKDNTTLTHTLVLCDLKEDDLQWKYYFTHMFSWVDLAMSSLLPSAILLIGNSVLGYRLITATRRARRMTVVPHHNNTPSCDEVSRNTVASLQVISSATRTADRAATATRVCCDSQTTAQRNDVDVTRSDGDGVATKNGCSSSAQQNPTRKLGEERKDEDDVTTEKEACSAKQNPTRKLGGERKDGDDVTTEKDACSAKQKPTSKREEERKRRRKSADSKRSKEASTITTTLIRLSVIFLLLTLPVCTYVVILNMGYVTRGDDVHTDAWLSLVWAVVNLLWYSNAALNFYVYVLTGTKFRQQCARVVCACRNRKRPRGAPAQSTGMSLRTSRTFATSTPGDTDTTTRGDTDSTTHGDTDSTTHGDTDSTIRGDTETTTNVDNDVDCDDDDNEIVDGQKYKKF